MDSKETNSNEVILDLKRQIEDLKDLNQTIGDEHIKTKTQLLKALDQLKIVQDGFDKRRLDVELTRHTLGMVTVKETLSEFENALYADLEVLKLADTLVNRMPHFRKFIELAQRIHANQIVFASIGPESDTLNRGAVGGLGTLSEALHRAAGLFNQMNSNKPLEKENPERYKSL